METIEGKALTDGTIEDDDGDDAPKSSSLSGSGSELVSRWVRIIRSGVNIAGAVDGFNWVKGSREWKVEGRLAKKVAQWKEEDRLNEKREEEEGRRMGRRWTEDPMDIDDADDDDDISDESEDDENDSEGVKTLKVSPLFVERTW